MKPIQFDETNVTWAENQPEYLPLPAHRADDGRTTFCWRLTWLERFQLLLRGLLWQQVLTFNCPLQPQKLTTEKPDLA